MKCDVMRELYNLSLDNFANYVTAEGNLQF
jgi:hypothetical protein